MRECDNGDMRDLLPDLVGNDSGRPELAAARAHAAGCECCGAELEFLRRVRDTMPAPRLDAARIAAAIPPYRPVPAWSRVARSPIARMAAVLVLAVGAATMGRNALRTAGTPDTAAIAMGIQPATELAVGTLADLSEAELETLLDDLGTIEAVPPSEEDIVVLPSLDREGS